MLPARVLCLAAAARGFRVAEDVSLAAGEEALVELGEALEAEEELSSEGFCVSPKFPTYYSFAQEDPNSADYAALWLDIDGSRAQLTALPGMHWVASFEDAAKRFGSGLRWDAYPQNGRDRQRALAEGVRLDLESDVRMVRRVRTKLVPKDKSGKEVPTRMYDPEASVLEIHHKSGGVDVFRGGVYYKDSIVKNSMLFDSFQRASSGVQVPDWDAVKHHLLSEDDPKKIEEYAKHKCLGFSWCAGFQYDPSNEVCTEKCVPGLKVKECSFTCRKTLVFYLADMGAGPVGQASPALGGLSACPKARWPSTGRCKGYSQTPLRSWISYRFEPRSSKGALLQGNLSQWGGVTKAMNFYSKKKAKYEEKYTGMSVPSMAHTMDHDTVGDHVSGSGRIAQAVNRIVRPGTALAQLSGGSPCKDDFPSAKAKLDEHAATLTMVGIDASSIQSCADAKRYCSNPYVGQPVQQYCAVSCGACAPGAEAPVPKTEIVPPPGFVPGGPLDVEVTTPNPALFAKTMSYRQAGTLASEKLFNHLKCVRGFKACGKDVLMPKVEDCPEP